MRYFLACVLLITFVNNMLFSTNSGYANFLSKYSIYALLVNKKNKNKKNCRQRKLKK